jgi:hypothetical protein
MNGGHKHYPHPDLAEKGSSLQVRILSSPLRILKRVNSYSSMKTEHTPGEWKVTDFRDGLQIFGRVDNDSVKIAEIYMPYRGVEDVQQNKLARSAEGLANARLIAAAPKLLEIANRLIEFDNKGELDRLIPYTMKLAKEAIQEATGSTHNTVNK